MHIPLYSTITLFAEMAISACIYYVLYQGYTHNKFPVQLAGFALLYEIMFNISYMVSQVPKHARVARIESPVILTLAILHGVLSLIMFLALIIFFILAWKQYKKGTNYFKKHMFFTSIFIIFWTFSVVSGILFYLLEYIF